MPHALFLQRARVGATLALICLLAGLVAACGGNNPPVTITFWSWVPKIQQAVDLFNQSHSNIKVELQNAGAGFAEYTKLSAALRDQASPPDVAQIEYLYLPEFEQNPWLLDLSSYEANTLKSDFVPWAWDQVSKGGKIYAIPQDSGEMVLLYRQDIFNKYHLAVPQTWAQYESEALRLHQLNPNISMTNFEASDSTWFLTLAAQDGSEPFNKAGKIGLNNPIALQVASYWENLLNAGAVSNIQNSTSKWYTELDNTAPDKPTIASWITGVWAPSALNQYVTNPAVKWSVALLPQWNPEAPVSETWGGSTDAITAQSLHPEQAFEFVKWLNTNEKSVEMLDEKLNLFPTQLSELSKRSFTDAQQAFYSGQAMSQIFTKPPSSVQIPYLVGSLEDYVVAQLQIQLTAALQNTPIDLQNALNEAQSAVASYTGQTTE